MVADRQSLIPVAGENGFEKLDSQVAIRAGVEAVPATAPPHPTPDDEGTTLAITRMDNPEDSADLESEKQFAHSAVSCQSLGTA